MYLAHLGKQQRILILLSLDTHRPLGVDRVLHLLQRNLEEFGEERALLLVQTGVNVDRGALLLFLVDGEESGSETEDGGGGVVERVGEEAEEEGKEGGGDGESGDASLGRVDALFALSRSAKCRREHVWEGLTSSQILQSSVPTPLRSFPSFSRNRSTSSLGLVLSSRPIVMSRPRTCPMSRTLRRASLSVAGMPLVTVSRSASAVAVRILMSAGEGRWRARRRRGMEVGVTMRLISIQAALQKG